VRPRQDRSDTSFLPGGARLDAVVGQNIGRTLDVGRRSSEPAFALAALQFATAADPEQRKVLRKALLAALSALEEDEDR
jgi:hypothetical protein